MSALPPDAKPEDMRRAVAVISSDNLLGAALLALAEADRQQAAAATGGKRLNRTLLLGRLHFVAACVARAIAEAGAVR